MRGSKIGLSNFYSFSCLVSNVYRRGFCSWLLDASRNFLCTVKWRCREGQGESERRIEGQKQGGEWDRKTKGLRKKKIDFFCKREERKVERNEKICRANWTNVCSMSENEETKSQLFLSTYTVHVRRSTQVSSKRVKFEGKRKRIETSNHVKKQ